MISEVKTDDHLCRMIEDKKQSKCCRCWAVIDPMTELCSWCIIEDQYEKTVYINAFTEIEDALKREHTAKTKKELIDQYNEKMAIIRSRERYNKE